MYPSIYIRADGGPQIGLGHLVRCVALAQMLSNDFSISFVSKQTPDSIASEIKRLGFNLLLIEEESEFLNVLGKRSIVILDHYALDSSYQKAIKQLGCKLVCIDDLHNKVFYADLIINHAPGVRATDYRAQLYTSFALGLDYVLLRPPFLQKARVFSKSAMSNAIKKVFVCFGGSDYKNITNLTVDILKNDIRFDKIDVVVGSSYIYLDELRKSTSEDQRFSLHISLTSETICDMISQADLSIVPASGILQEVISVGKRVISGMYADNQNNIFKQYKSLNAFASAECFSREDIKNAIELIFRKPSVNRNTSFIDGKSPQRLLRHFKQLELAEQVIIRKAEETDLQRTFDWASKPEIRKFFFDKNPVEFEAHKTWFRSKLRDANCFYYLGVFQGNTFGSVRIDLKGEKAVISYLVDPDFQSRGLGLILLQKALVVFLQQVKVKVASISGEVLSGNVASSTIFERLGFDCEIDEVKKIVKFNKLVPKA